MAFNVGQLVAELGFSLDNRELRAYERALEKTRAEAKRGVHTQLGAQLDRRDFEAYGRELDKVQARVRRREAFRAELGADFDPKAFNAYERELKRTQRANDDTVRSNARLRTAFGSVWGAGGAAFAAAGGAYAVVTAVKSVTSAYAESQVSQAKMATQLKALGVSYDAHAKQIDEVIQRTSKLAGLDDEDLQDAFTNIVRATGKVSESLRLTGLAADIARAKHLDVAKAGQLVGKVAEGNTSALSRYGIQIEKGATASQALAELQRRFAGQAEAYGKTQQGSAERLQVAWENLRETLGQKLAPILTRVQNRLAEFVDQMQSGTGAGGRFVDKLEAAWDWLTRMGGRAKDVAGFIKDHKDAVKAAAAAWVAFRVAVAGANTVAKASAALSILTGGRVGTGAAARAAGTSIAGPRGGGGGGGLLAGLGARAGVGGAAAGVSGAIVAAGSVKAIADAVRGGDASDLGLLNNYAKAIERVAKAGDSAGMRKLADQLRAAAAANRDLTKGHNLNHFADVLDATARSGGKDLSGLAAAFRALGRTTNGELRDAGRDVQSFARTTKPSLGDVKEATETITSRFEQFESRGGKSIRDLRGVVANNIHDIRVKLGSSKEATDALATNFDDARKAISTAMHRGEISTRDGMAEIRRLTRQELRELGLTNLRSGQQNTAAASENARGQIVANRYTGGWIGAPGMVGPDTVPAMLGVGEAVLNRHQQAVIEGLLGDGFLDRLFATVQRPHYMAAGGRAGLQPAVSRLASSLASRFGLTITSTTGGTHAPGSFHYEGLAADLGGSGEAMSRASRYLMSSGVYRSLLEGIHDPGLSVKNGQTVPPSFWGAVWGQHANHIHIALRALGQALAGGGDGGMWQDISAPRVGGSGAMRVIVQGRLTQAARAINARGRALAASMGGGDTASQGVAQGAGADVIAAFRRAIASTGASPLERLALWEAGIVESGLRNRPYGDRDSLGALQERTSIYGRAHALDPYASAVRFLHQAIGLRPWRGSAGALAQAVQRSAFPGRYDGVAGQARQYLAPGGLVRRFNLGGWAGRRFGPTHTQATPVRGPFTIGSGIGRRPKATAGLERLQVTRIGEYQDLAGKVDDAEKAYSQQERAYNLTDEVLVDPDTGALNAAAIKQRADEIQGLIEIRERILAYEERMRTIAARVVQTYQTIINRLQASLRFAKRKDRSGIQNQISQYQNDLESTWGPNLHELVTSTLPDTRLDIQELLGEKASVLGTQPQTDPNAATGGSDPTNPTGSTPAAPSVPDIAAAAYQDFQTYTQNLSDALRSFPADAITPQQAFAAGGPLSVTPDALAGALGGARFFGAGADLSTGLGGLGQIKGTLGAGVSGPIIIVQDGGAGVQANFASAPDNAPTLVQQMRFQLETGLPG